MVPSGQISVPFSYNGKRVIDLIFSVIGLLILSPIFIVVSILIKATSKGPVLFIQKRIGLNSRPFLMYKFRTMNQDAEMELLKIPSLQQWDGPVIRIKDDPRVTRVGVFLRHFCVDELPQLFNVLLGEMSIVGPRPHLPEEVARYEPWHHGRLHCKPGMTCIWQINDRHNVAFNDWIKMDLYYVKNCTLSLDIKIIAATFFAFVSKKHNITEIYKGNR
jgi:lipopolysaccharide/colanic/teichoic acid biosynthesis glycosyltransferase